MYLVYRLSQSSASLKIGSCCTSILCIDIVSLSVGTSTDTVSCTPSSEQKLEVLRGVILVPHFIHRLFQSLASLTSLSCCASFLCIYVFPLLQAPFTDTVTCTPLSEQKWEVIRRIVLVPHLVYRLSQSLASLTSLSYCASFLCICVVFMSAGTYHRLSLLHILV